MPPSDFVPCQAPWDDTVDLRQLLLVLLRRKWLILGLTFAAAAVAAVLSFFVLPPVYESEAVLQLPPAQVSEEAGFTLQAFAALASSPAILQEAAVLLHEEIAPEELYRVYKANLDPASRLLRLKAEGGTARQAQQRLAAWVNAFTAAVARSMQQAASDQLAVAESVLKVRQAELEAARRALETFLAQHAIHALEAQAQTLEAQLLASEEQIRDLTLYRIPADEERLAFLAAELERQPLTWQLEGNATVVDPGPAGQMSVSQAGAVVNPAYLQLQQELIATSARLAENRTLLKQLTDFTAEAVPQLAEMRAELSRLRLEQARLADGVTAAEALYERARDEYVRWANQASSLQGVGVHVVSEPTLPPAPVRPRKMLNVAVAAFLGLFVSIGLTFLLEIWPAQEAPRPAAAGVRE